MTQFVLIISNSCNENLLPASKEFNLFSYDVVNKKYPNLSIVDSYVIDFENKDIDDLMLDAQQLISSSYKFKQTKLYSIIQEIAIIADEIIFWYGSDCEDLDNIYDVETLLGELESSIRESNCEFYAHFKKSNNE